MESGHEQMSERCAWPPNPNPNPNPNPIPIPIPNGDGGSSCTRWNPTAEQLKMLRELYYSSGIRCPTPDQIQRISWALSRYGKIEGKNVFYWFQNHKARERQKKRFFTTCTCMQAKRESQSLPLTLFSASSAKTMGYSEENSRRSFPCSFNKDLDCEDANGVSEDNNNHPVETLDLFPMKNGVQN